MAGQCLGGSGHPGHGAAGGGRAGGEKATARCACGCDGLPLKQYIVKND